MGVRLLLICAVTAALVAGLDAAGVFRRPELATVDARFSLRGSQGPSPRVVVVAIDESEDWPFPRSEHAMVIDRLRRAGASVIAYDVEFTKRTTDEEDNALILAIERARGRIVLAASATDDGQPATLGGGDILERIGARAGSVLIPADPGGVYRRLPLEREGLRAMAVEAARRRPAGPGRAVWIDYRGEPGTIRTYPFFDVRDGKVPAAAFRRRVVVVGAADPVLQDVHPTSAGGGLMTGPEIQANAIDTLLRGEPLRSPPGWIGVVLVLALGIMPALLRPLALVPVAGLGYAGISYGAFAAGVILPTVAPLTALALGGIAALSLRLLEAVIERRIVRDRFARFVDERVVSDVLARTDDDLRLGGTRLEATVLFCDLRGFTSFAEDRPAEQVIDVLNHYHEIMSEAILGEGGTLVALTGDGIMAVFGAPLPSTDHAERALRAVRSMLAGLESFNGWLRGEGLGEGLAMGVGVHAGVVMSGNVGGRRRLEYTVIGDTTNTASRLESLTKEVGHPVLLSREVRDRLPPSAAEGLQLVGELRVRGRRASIEGWTLRGDGAGPDASGDDPTAGA